MSRVINLWSRKLCQKQNGFLLTCCGVVMLQQSAGSCDDVGLSTGVKHAGVNQSLSLPATLPLCFSVFLFAYNLSFLNALFFFSFIIYIYFFIFFYTNIYFLNLHFYKQTKAMKFLYRLFWVVSSVLLCSC